MDMQLVHASSNRNQPWRDLSEPGFKSSVYLACWLPRTQTDAIRWIYRSKTSTNIRPVIEARRFLEQHRYLQVERTTNDLRSIKLVSQPAPFLPYAMDRLKEIRPRKGAQVLSDEELEVLRRILDSDWFRKSFTERLEHWRRKGIGSQSLRDVAEYVEEIATVTLVFAKGFPGTSPTTKDVLAAAKFDQFIENWYNTVLKKKPRLISVARRTAAGYRNRVPDEGEVILTKNTLDHPALPPLCIPLSLADKLSRVGRIQLTLLSHLFESLEEAFEFEHHNQEVEFQKLVTVVVSQDMSKFLYNGMVSKTTPHSTYMLPAAQDELEISEKAGLSVSVSWESPAEGIASTLFNDYLSLPSDAREGVRNLVLWAYWTGVREKVEIFLSDVMPGENMAETIRKNKTFLEEEVIPKARKRNYTGQIIAEQALLEILSVTEQLIAKDNLAEFLGFALSVKGKIDDLMRIVLRYHRNYPASGELLFGQLTEEFGERMFDGLIAAGERERIQQLLPRHILEALDVWNGFVSKMLSTYDDDARLSEIRGRLDASKDRLRACLEFLPSLVNLMQGRKIGVAYFWAS